jgi:PIN domain nuclease of toxin-antitoxin system
LRLLLDSHVLLWWLQDNSRLSADAAQAIESGAEAVLVSAASIWEIEIKRLGGRLPAPEHVLEQVEDIGFLPLEITPDHALDAARLPRHHGDPFDRLLVAQAQAEAATLVTDDAALAAYDVPIMRARG